MKSLIILFLTLSIFPMTMAKSIEENADRNATFGVQSLGGSIVVREVY